MIAIVVSRADSASEHVGEHLLDAADWETFADDSRPAAAGGGRCHRTEGFELRTFDDLHLDLEGVADAFDSPEFLVFASRHAGDTGPLLTAHFTGNFGPAEYGGRDDALARACPNAHAEVMAALEEHAPEEYEVGTECTHHGPSEVGVPSMFVELGSGEAQWTDPEGARAVAEAILDLEGAAADRERTVVGFGGGHYAPRFARIVRETGWAVGHVAADWGLDAMGAPAANRDLVERAFVRSNATRAVLDGDHPDLEAVIEDLGYEVVSETWLREVGGVPLDLAAELESELVPVDEGLRFGTPAAGVDPGTGYEVVSLPTELLDDAGGTDPGATREAVAARALAFVTGENGNRLTGGMAVPDAAAREGIVDALADVLRGKYERVGREGSELVVHERAFDPGKAAALGVEEGPAFGKLASGEAVETSDGRTIRPAQVRTERTRRYAF